MFAKLRAALASPAGLRLVVPVLIVSWGINQLVELVAELEAAAGQKADELAALEVDYADLADERVRVLVAARDGYARDVERLAAERDELRRRLAKYEPLVTALVGRDDEHDPQCLAPTGHIGPCATKNPED